MKVLVFGGAFNPPTNAHIQLAKYAMEQVGAEKVVFVPTKQKYVLDEQKKDSSFSDEERLAMLQKVADHNSWMFVSDYEIHEAAQPRTYQTLCHLKQEGLDGSLLLGSDKLEELETGWLFVDEICQKFGIVCMVRSHDDVDHIFETNAFLQERKPFIQIVSTPECYQDVSSTKVRKMISSLKEDGEQPTLLKELRKAVPEELDGMKEYL